MSSARILAACVVVLVLFPLFGEAGSSEHEGAVAVLDVGRVFEGHQAFRTAVEGLHRDLQAAEGGAQERAEALGKLKAQLAQLEPGSDAHRELEARIGREEIDLKLSGQVKRTEIYKREAQLYEKTYAEITRVVGTYAAGKGIRLVVRFSSGPIDPNNRNSVQQGINRRVVYQAGLDITDDVLKLLNG